MLTFSHITFGFVISHLMFAVLGAMGRFFHFSFETIKLLMAAAGSVLTILYLLSLTANGVKIQIKKIRKNDLLPGLVDDVRVTYRLPDRHPARPYRRRPDLPCLYHKLAELPTFGFQRRNFRHSRNSSIPASGLSSAPFAQAPSLGLGNVTGILLISGYYEPFLVVLSVLCWYELARTLKFFPVRQVLRQCCSWHSSFCYPNTCIPAHLFSHNSAQTKQPPPSSWHRYFSKA